MRPLRRFLIRLTAAVSGRRDEERLRAEIEQHLELQTAENIRAGLSQTEARRQAVFKFGAAEAIKDRHRDEQRLPFLEHVSQDVRYTLRQLHKSPLFTLTATLSLAVGIGATAAVFTLVDRLLLKSLPVAQPHELVFVADQRSPQEHSPRFSYPFYAALRENNTLSGVAAHFSMALNATIDGQLARVRGELVSGNYFSVIGATTHVGRPFTTEDDRTPGSHAVAVISDTFWRRNYASDPSVLGRGVRVNDATFTVIGVAMRGFTGTDVGSPTDIWIPMTMQRAVGRDLLTDARTNWIEIIGRLRTGASAERSAAELTEYVERAPSLQAPSSSGGRRRMVLLPAAKGNSGLRREIGPALRILLALTTLALVLACINVASLLAVRSATRQKEIAVKLALGARRSRLGWQFLTETLVLSSFGGTAGLLLAPWATRLLIGAQPDSLGIDPSLDLRVFMFGVAMSVLTGLCVALAPIIASRKIGLAQVSSNSSPATLGTSRRLTAHDVIVTGQIAVSLTMLISAGLLVQSVRGLRSVDPGFRAEGLLLVSADPRAIGYDRHRADRFWRDTVDRVSRIPGVESASLARIVPLSPARQRQPVFDATSGTNIEIDTNFVSPRYFRTVGIPVLRGREFDDHDSIASRPVVIVNERLARLLWPGEDALGKDVRMARTRLEVVGVVRDVKYRDLRGDDLPILFRPAYQSNSSDPMTLHVRATTDAAVLAGTIRGEMQSLDAAVPLFDIKTLDEQLNASFAQTRQAAVLTGAFGILALVLSGIGVYGVTALAVSRRTQDIGIRMALGAHPRDIVRLIGRRGLTLVSIGLALGLAGSFGFTRIAEALLFGVTASDSATFAGMSALLAAVSLSAIYIPAKAATRLDAVGAIRHQ